MDERSRKTRGQEKVSAAQATLSIGWTGIFTGCCFIFFRAVGGGTSDDAESWPSGEVPLLHHLPIIEICLLFLRQFVCFSNQDQRRQPAGKQKEIHLKSEEEGQNKNSLLTSPVSSLVEVSRSSRTSSPLERISRSLLHETRRMGSNKE